MNLQENISECNGKIQNRSLKSEIINKKVSYSPVKALIFKAFGRYSSIDISVDNIISRILLTSFVKRGFYLINHININIPKRANLVKFRLYDKATQTNATTTARIILARCADCRVHNSTPRD
jgi:hypothetical protein